jgi:hypothetical protein
MTSPQSPAIAGQRVVVALSWVFSIGIVLRSQRLCNVSCCRFARDALLHHIAAEAMTMLHQVWLHAYTPIGETEVVQASPS